MARFDEERLSDLRSLRAIFLVPDNGSPVHDTMTHIAALAQRDRLWFERCEVAGTGAACCGARQASKIDT